MISTDRKDFEEQIKILVAGYPPTQCTTERVEAYWIGLQKMKISSLAHVVERALSEEGPDKLPGPKELWRIYRALRTVHNSNAPAPHEKPMMPWAIRYANIVLLRYINEAPDEIDEETLQRLVEQKNKTAKQFIDIATEEDVTGDEVKRVLWPRLQATHHPEVTP